MNLINLRKQNLFKATLALAMGLSLGFTSCKDNDDKYETPQLEIVGLPESGAISFAKDGGVQEFTIKANRKWNITSDADWLSFDPKSGDAGDVRVRVTALTNSATPRTANITINGLNTPKVITVNQAGEGSNADFSVVIFEEKFEKLDLGCFTVKGLDEGSYTWKVWANQKNENDKYVSISAYKSKTDKTRAYLISPEIKFTAPTKLSFQYKPAHARPGTTLKLFLLDANKEPIGDALKVLDPSEPASGYAKTYTDEVVILPANENAKYFAFFYEGDKTHTTTFQMDNFKLEGPQGSTPVNCSGKDNTDPVTPPTTDPDPSGDYSVLIFNEGFEKLDLACFTVKGLDEGSKTWEAKEYQKNNHVEITAYKSTTDKTRAYLISPEIKFTTPTKLSFQYKPAHAKAGTTLKVLLLDASKNPIGEVLKVLDPSEPASGYAKTYTDEVVMIPANENAKYFALFYEGDKTHTTTFQLDNFKLEGGKGSTPVNCSGKDNTNPVTPPDSNPGTDPAPAPTGGEVFFLDYIEGSGNEKYLSIYNPTNQDITLNGYSIVVEQYNNSNKKAKGANPSLKLDGKVIKAMSTLVFSHGGANNKPEGTITDSSVCNFNGNDNIYLEKNGKVIDAIGNAKGSAWVNGKDFAGSDKGLHRKTSVNAPSETFKIDEWEVLGKDDVSKLGKR